MSVKVGFIGAGRMAGALARGFIQGQVVQKPSQILASCPKQDQHLLDEVKGLGCETMHCNKTLVQESDVVFLAVKPGIIPLVSDEIKSTVTERNNLVVSIAAGIPLNQLRDNLNPGTKIIRLMPNTPCIVREGVSVFCVGDSATKDDAALVKKLMKSVGECEEVNEQLVDAVTGVSASGPAYMFMILESMADGGVKMGLPRALAYKLAAQTMIGSGKMVLDTQQHPAVLKDEVCSPGGTTITALDILEKSGLRTSMMQAVEAATKRCAELASP